jgi:hypothetical protein
MIGRKQDQGRLEAVKKLAVRPLAYARGSVKMASVEPAQRNRDCQGAFANFFTASYASLSDSILEIAGT